MKQYKIIYLLLSITFLQISCKDFLKIDPPKSSLVNETVFQNNDQAISAVTGMYATMVNASSFASGSSNSISCYAGLSSDELLGYGAIVPFYENQLTPEFGNLSSLYAGLYKTIYTANSILEALSLPNGVTPPMKTQLEGETLFTRAFAYFYLVNLFGEVPLHLTSDYRITSDASKASVTAVYQQIVKDLKVAEHLLVDAYPTEGRVRPTRSAVQAMLARTYLYLQDYINAEEYASLVLSKSTMYNLVSFETVFLPGSKEAIWQLMPVANTNTSDGALHIPASLAIPPVLVSLRPDFIVNVIEPNDKRREIWIRSYAIPSGTYYYAYKYRARVATTPTTEYSMVLRLAEQYIIRAEARINQGKIDVGIADLNMVRNRTLPNIGNSNPISVLPTTLSKEEALFAVEHERYVELFSEWGHRWFDLKRTGRATPVLADLKRNWQITDVLYPIPQNEISRNPNITQNTGY